MNGSLPPSSSTTFFPTAPAWAATARPAPDAAGQGHRCHPAVGDDGRDLVGADEQGLEHAVGSPGPAEQILQQQRRAGHVGGVLQQARRCRP